MMFNLIKNIIKFGKITNSITDTGDFPKGQVIYNDKTKQIFIIYPYGTHGIPPIDSIVLLNSIGGNEENQAGIATKPKIRPKLQKPGEFVCGNFVIGSTIKFDALGNIIIDTKNNLTANITGVANITCPTTTFTGNVVISGALALGGIVTAVGGGTYGGNFITTGQVTAGTIPLSTHKHTGVTPGVGISGGPTP